MHVPCIEIRQVSEPAFNTTIDWDGTTVKGPVYIGSGVLIEAGVTITGLCQIGHGSHIAKAPDSSAALFLSTRVLHDVTLQ
jgi:mannose-1-phosphate guanylyltransferase